MVVGSRKGVCDVMASSNSKFQIELPTPSSNTPLGLLLFVLPFGKFGSRSQVYRGYHIITSTLRAKNESLSQSEEAQNADGPKMLCEVPSLLDKI